MASFDFDKYQIDEFGCVYKISSNSPGAPVYLIGKKLPGETDRQAILRISIDHDENGGPEV